MIFVGAVLVLAIACRGGAGTGGSTAIPVFTSTPTPQNCLNDEYPSDAPQFGDDTALDYTITDSGLGILTHSEGTGDTPGPESTVTMHYTGFLTDGCIFDTSRNRLRPTEFEIVRMIDGMAEGVLGMQAGGSSRFRIPSDLGYGPFGFPGAIPPNSQIIFEVELVEVDPVDEDSATTSAPATN